MPKIDGIDKADMFYDETPRVRFEYQMKVNCYQAPFVFHYSTVLDGVDDDMKIKTLHTEAQVGMYNALQRIWQNNEDAEFVAWRCYDDKGALLEESDVLSIYVKDTGEVRAITPA